MRSLIYLLVTLSLVIFCVAKQDVYTNPSQSDGFGSQFQSIIAAVLYAEAHKTLFCYTPFTAMEHNYDNDPHFIEKKERLINFMGNFSTIDQLDAVRYNIISSINYKAFLDAYPAHCAKSKALRLLKKIFRANKAREDYFDNDHMHIVLHVRRHNAQDNRVAGTNIPDITFLEIIKKLRDRYASRSPLFHIYSQGESAHFSLFKAPDTIIHLNDSVEDTFTAMVLADGLVMSPSSLSYAAALLSDGDIYYMPFWHNPLPHWTII